MSDVRQAHMPGNYELYDVSLNKLGPVICKACWETSNKANSDSLDTVWASSEGRRVVWWLCRGHEEELRSGGMGPAKFLKSVHGVISSPGL